MRKLNNPVLWNFTGQGDFCEGRELSVDVNSEGTYRCECCARDIDEICSDYEFSIFKKIFGKNMNIDSENYNKIRIVLVEPGCRIVFPRGTILPYRDLIIYHTPEKEKEFKHLEKSSIYFKLIQHYKNEMLQYKSYYDKSQKNFKEWENKIDELAKVNAELADEWHKRLKIVKELNEPKEKKEENE